MAKRGGGLGLSIIGDSALELGIAGLVIAMLIYGITRVKTNLASNDSTVNTTLDYARDAGAEFGSWLVTLAAVVAIVLMIGLLMLLKGTGKQ